MKTHQRPQRKPNDRFNPNVEIGGFFSHTQFLVACAVFGVLLAIMILVVAVNGDRIDDYIASLFK